MNKFDKMKKAAEEAHKVELARIEKAREDEIKKFASPLAGKLSAILQEEVERVVVENIDLLDDYKFRKIAVRKKIRDFILEEIKEGCATVAAEVPPQAETTAEPEVAPVEIIAAQ